MVTCYNLILIWSFQAVLNANVRAGNWLVVIGAGGGLGHLAGESRTLFVNRYS